MVDRDHAGHPSGQRNGYVFHHGDNPALESAMARAIGLWHRYPQDFRYLMLNAHAGRSFVGAAGSGLSQHLRPHQAQMSHTLSQHEVAEFVDGLPNLSGEEELIAATIAGAATRRVYPMPESGDPFAGINSAFAVALHMHQPLIPAGGRIFRRRRSSAI